MVMDIMEKSLSILPLILFVLSFIVPETDSPLLNWICFLSDVAGCLYWGMKLFKEDPTLTTTNVWMYMGYVVAKLLTELIPTLLPKGLRKYARLFFTLVSFLLNRIINHRTRQSHDGSDKANRSAESEDAAGQMEADVSVPDRAERGPAGTDVPKGLNPQQTGRKTESEPQQPSRRRRNRKPGPR